MSSHIASKDENLFFVGVKDHLEVRKDLLVSSKNLLSSLKQHETFCQLKEQKSTLVVDLQRVFDELLILNKKLRNIIPKLPTKDLDRDEPEKLPKGKLDLLDDELARVERRLSSL